MGMRVIIENTGDIDTEEGSDTLARVEFHDKSDRCSAERLGELIGYALNGVESFVVPGDVITGIESTMNSRIYRSK